VVDNALIKGANAVTVRGILHAAWLLLLEDGKEHQNVQPTWFEIAPTVPP